MSSLTDKLKRKATETVGIIRTDIDRIEEALTGETADIPLEGSVTGESIHEGVADAFFVPVKGMYEAKRLHTIILSRGQRVKPNEHGYYTPMNEEEYDLMEYFANQGLISRVE